MSRPAPFAPPDEQLRLARALGLKPLRLRSRPRPEPPARLRVASVEPLETLRQDPLLQAVLNSLGVAIEDIGPSHAGAGPLLAIGLVDTEADVVLPELTQLRCDAAAKRSLWPALRCLRRRLLNA